MRHTPEYASWCAMRQRCENPNNPSYRYYGARGISISAQFQTFEGFFAALGPRPAGHSLDRIDVDGNYSPDNVRWATKRTQMLNRTDNRRVTIGGKTLTVTEWAEHAGVRPATMWRRLRRGVIDPLQPTRNRSQVGRIGAEKRWR